YAIAPMTIEKSETRIALCVVVADLSRWLQRRPAVMPVATTEMAMKGQFIRRSPPAFVVVGVPAAHQAAPQLDGDVGRARFRIGLGGLRASLTCGDDRVCQAGIEPAQEASLQELLSEGAFMVMPEECVSDLV